MKHRRLWSALAVAAVSTAAGSARADAAAFTPGDVTVYRVGAGGTTALNSGTANPVFIDEYSPSGTLVQSIPLPTTPSGANLRLVSGVGFAQGLLTRSVDGRFLVLPGYAAETNGAGPTIPRVVGFVASTGAVDTSTGFTDGVSSPVGAASTDGTDLWLAASNGVRFATRGASGASTQVGGTAARGVGIFGGQLYATVAFNAPLSMTTVGTGTPTTSGQPVANLPGISSTTTPSPYAFSFADLDTSVAGVDTLYIADDTSSAKGGVQKWSLVSGTWSQNGTIGVGSALYRGLTLQKLRTVTGAILVRLYATRNAGGISGSPGELVTIDDTAGYNAAPSSLTPTLLATGAANTRVRGVALAPLAATPTASVWRGGAARVAQPGVVVTWRTGVDLGNLGFDVLRVRRSAARRVKLTRRVIVGSAVTGTGSARGSYAYHDGAGRLGDRYFVVARGLDGSRTEHGPFVARG